MTDLSDLNNWIAQGEALDREYKSDQRRQFTDKEIYEEVVALANTDGGVLLIGVEDDGAVTGARHRHGTATEPFKVQAAIFNNTVPSINTRVSVISHPDGNVLAIEVDSYPEPCATASGKSLRRTINSEGKPQSVPFYPRDQRSRRVDLGLLDFSAQTLDSVSFSDLDPLEFERLRQTIVRLKGDRSLLQLKDDELAKALKLVETRGDQLLPSVSGLLLLGRESVIADVLPTHGVQFQVIDAQAQVKVNETFRGPLLRILEDVEKRFTARNNEQEVQVGMYRVPVPDYSPDGFREAVSNAVLHRDYTRLGDVYIQWHPDHMLITSPGGLVEGITLENLLVHEPKPRNPRLAEAMKRAGIVEGTARGIDRIYLGQLRYGRPAPDYSRSDASGVRVVLRGGSGSLEFAAFVFERESTDGRPLSVDDLLILNSLFHERRIDSEHAGQLIQKGTAEGRSVLERLHERGLVEARGERRGRIYHLSASVYRKFGKPEAYVRSHGIDPIRQEAMVLEYLEAHGRIERKHVMELCGLKGPQAGRLLTRMCERGKLKREGSPPRWTYYVPAQE
jgi:ATP-dependent DNA helicase RecG